MLKVEGDNPVEVNQSQETSVQDAIEAWDYI